jgi:bleomycin hydrolase
VPKDVMPETYNSEKTSTMQKLIKRKLREDGIRLRKMTADGASYDFLQKKKIEMLGDIYRMLVVSLGEPPVEFSWRYKDKDGNITPEKEYTPKSFYNEVIGVDMSEYVLFMDDPTRPYYKLYEIEYDRNMHEGRNWKFVNLPASEIKAFALESLKNNEAMYFSCDVGKQLNSDYGTLDLNNYDYESLFGVKFGMNKKERVQAFDSGSSHGMALVGVDVNEKEEITKWLLENSWGSKSGHNGYLAMTDDWFDQYMFRVVINKKFVDEKTLKILKQKAKKLPPWDPMFLMDN